MLLKLPPAKHGLSGPERRWSWPSSRPPRQGTALVFGYLGGGPSPFDLRHPQNSFVLAFRALPLLLVISALSALLFHWRILPLVVRGFAWVLRRTLGTGGPLGLAAAANVFVGMTEAPLLIRPYLAGPVAQRAVRRHDLRHGHRRRDRHVPLRRHPGAGDPGRHGPHPHRLHHQRPGRAPDRRPAGPGDPRRRRPGPGAHRPPRPRSAMDAITRGTLDAIPLWLNILAMLVVMVALVGIVNQVLGLLPDVAGAPLTAQRALGWVMAPVVWLIGIPWSEATTAGALMGVKTVLNELVAYLQLAALPPGALSERSALIMTYALCGFANFGSLGILIGGTGRHGPAAARRDRRPGHEVHPRRDPGDADDRGGGGDVDLTMQAFEFSDCSTNSSMAIRAPE